MKKSKILPAYCLKFRTLKLKLSSRNRWQEASRKVFSIKKIKQAGLKQTNNYLFKGINEPVDNLLDHGHTNKFVIIILIIQ